jgi:hypothetical protein
MVGGVGGLGLKLRPGEGVGAHRPFYALSAVL